MAVSWETLRSLGFVILPIILPRVPAVIRWLRTNLSSLSRSAPQIRPVPKPTQWALSLLFLSALVAFISTLPFFAPENIFILARSRPQNTTTGVLFARLAALRPLTPTDEKLRLIFEDVATGGKSSSSSPKGWQARILYATYGPGPLIDCTLASPNDKDALWWFFLYALPTLLGPHVIHLIVLGIATSSALLVSHSPQQPNGVASVSPAQKRLRLVALALAASLGVFELYYTAWSSGASITEQTKPTFVGYTFWTMRLARGLSIAVIDAFLGWCIWLQASGRAFQSPPGPPSPEVALNTHLMAMNNLLARLRALSVLRNGVMRSDGLRSTSDIYWQKEEEVMREVLEDPEVVDAIRASLAADGGAAGQLLDIAKVEQEAQTFVNHFISTSPQAVLS